MQRVAVDVGGGSELSALRWGTGAPELVLLHGGAQNAHTWDTVALALDRPLVAIDLPGHGHSSHRDDHVYWPADNAVAVEAAVRALAPDAKVVVGMSLGGLTALALTDRAPDLVRSLVLVDVTPGVNREKSSAIAQFIDGPEYFESFDEILERTVAFNPTRTRVVAAARHPAQRDRGARRPLALALRPAASRDAAKATTGRIMPGLDELWDAVGARAACRSRWCAAACRRSSTTTTSPSCAAATRAPSSRSSRAPGTACRATSRSSWRGSSRDRL